MKYFKTRISSIVYLALLFLFVPVVTNAAASLFLSPASGTYKSGELFSVIVNVNTGEDAINAGAAQINFDNTHLEVVSLGYSHSIFSLWTERPSFSNPGGFIKFSGGVPNPGYTGSRGDILRATFRAKTTGQSPLTFLSASVLANDGSGSNIVDVLKGALFTIIAPTPVVTKPGEKNQVENVEDELQIEESSAAIPVPIITQWLKQAVIGETLTVEGLGHPLDKIVFIIQRNNDTPETGHTYPAPDGRFIYTYPKALQKGIYQIWARNVNTVGDESGLSNPVHTEVIGPTYIKVGSLVFNYASIIVTLVAVITLGCVGLSWMWIRYRKWRLGQKMALDDVENSVHKSFDTLTEGLGSYVGYLGEAKSVSGVRKREHQTKLDLKKQLKQIEEALENEIDDIKNR